MSKIKATIGAAIATIAIGGMVIVAPPASAALCGYPPVECPAGTTNPPEPQPIGGTPREQAQSGMTLPDEATAKATPPTRAPEPATKIGDSPKIAADKGEVVKVRAVLDDNVTYRVLVKRNDGVYNFVGTVTSGPSGGVTLPAIQFDRAGTYTIALQDGTGGTSYIKVTVS